MERYRTMIQDQWNEIRDALPGDNDAQENRERVRPPDANSAALRALYEKAIAEVPRTDKALSVRVFEVLETLHRRQQVLLDEAWYLWKSGSYYSHRDNPLSSAWDAVEAAWKELDIVLPVVKATADGDRPSVPPPLTDIQRSVLELLQSLPTGKGLGGRAIITRLRIRGKGPVYRISQGVLTSRIMPTLKQHYGVQNTRTIGYYIQK